MAKKPLEPVALQRTPQPPKRRLRWWWALLIILLTPLVALGIWILSLRGAFTPPEPTATLPPQAVAAESGIFYQTTFDDPAVVADWEIFDDGRIAATISEGQLTVSISAMSDTGAWSGLNAAAFTDFVLDVDATKLGGSDDNAMVIIFRRIDDANYNRFDVTSDGFYALSILRAGEYRIVSNYGRSPAILTGNATNHIRIRAIGDTFRFEVNDTPLPLCVSSDPIVQPIWDPNATQPSCLGGQVVDAWQNADLPEGRIGLGAQAFTGFDPNTGQVTMAEAVVGFDNLVIQKPENVP